MTRPTPRSADLDPDLVLRAYAMGVFPMAEHRDEDSVFWVEPRQRAILPLDGFHLSRSLRRTIISDRFRVTADAAFEQVIALCAESAPDRPDTWINPSIEKVFGELHRRGFAHSVEVWEGERLAGGLYGLALGRAFFGESMVSRARDASKVAIAALVARLRVGEFELLDCQFMTDHLASLGAVEVPRETYLSMLSDALGEGAAGLASGAAGVSADFGALDAFAAPPDPLAPAPLTSSPPVSGKVIAQLLTQTS
ncbi:leucyl/phenylalanyl-tRNA--protein transferase [Sphingomonas sp. BT-65]|uniref:leucyl/phenylalanyl-tRNA--protein transferase n=1 Tax=Sphingomonas sp. BT-65 TaxID=2989821 RepID=UPI00223689D6|nr:leucyl/phenylalanyl-tRNA--protein transferase [Sphingomonas sp. BT-65]MCW4463128.1 leucyl/phenylalanyl-tRNA--protein transferase [Sphingomonas sp. BT-65]